MPNEIRAEIIEAHDRFYRSVYGYCAYRLFSKDLAEDAAAEVFLKLLKKKRPLQWGRGSSDLYKWLLGTASNVVNAYLRDAQRRRQIAEELARRNGRGGLGPDDQGRQDWLKLYEAISRLSPKSQEIIALRYFQEHNAVEIAAITGLTHGTVRARLSRALRKLKCELGTSFGELHEKT